MSCGLVKGRSLSTKRRKWMERIAIMGERCVQVLVSKTEEKGLLVSPRRRWENNNKMALQGVGWGRALKLCAF
jgi:hypothetical protein